MLHRTVILFRVCLLTELSLEQDKYWTGRDTSELPVARVKAAIAKRLAEISKI
jgi:hypothetical protein